jgi:hypothetical protein
METVNHKAAFDKYMDAIYEAEKLRWTENKYDIKNLPTFDFTRTSYGQTSVHCFVEKATGDIFKAETFSRPAKKARGNVNNDTYPLVGYDFYHKKTKV